MQKLNYLLSILILTILSGSYTKAQSQSKLEIKPTLTSRHYWRGIMVNHSANIETDIVFNSKKLKFGVWGGYALDNTYSEFDLHIDYEITDNLSVSVWDLYASRDHKTIDDYDYVDFKRKTTNHLIDASFRYSFGNKLPLKFIFSTLVFGRDLNENGKQNYSSYFEINYKYLLGKSGITCFVGTNIFDNSMYGEKTNIVNIGVKVHNKIKLSETIDIPIWGNVAFNPEAKTVNLILGIGF